MQTELIRNVWTEHAFIPKFVEGTRPRGPMDDLDTLVLLEETINDVAAFACVRLNEHSCVELGLGCSIPAGRTPPWSKVSSNPARGHDRRRRIAQRPR